MVTDWNARGYADDYSKTNTPPHYFYQERMTLVLRLLSQVGSGGILDVGCGPGMYAKPCVERGLKYTGFDLSRQMIEEARRRFGDLPNVEFLNGDAGVLPFPTDSFDGVLCLGVLEYVSQKDEAVYLKELARVTKPGGMIIFSFLNARSPAWLLTDYVSPMIKFSSRNSAASIRKFTVEKQSKVLHRAGLSVVGKSYFASNILPPVLGRRLPHHTVWLSSKLEPLLRTPLSGWLAMAFVLAAEKPESGLIVEATPHRRTLPDRKVLESQESPVIPCLQAHRTAAANMWTEAARKQR
jgi:ubiquinone/menaquinone biosynthesis C-methylase UbiE